MKCRYCGQEVKTVGHALNGSYGQQCKTSPTGKHVGLTDGTNCVYCGFLYLHMVGALIARAITGGAVRKNYDR